MPFATGTFDLTFSYSVQQHFSKKDVHQALTSIALALKPNGTCMMQMPNRYGVRSLCQQIRRRFVGVGPELKNCGTMAYWTPQELALAFADAIGETSISVDGFFGLGIQPSDIDMLPCRFQLIARCSEALRQAASMAPLAPQLRR